MCLSPVSNLCLLFLESELTRVHRLDTIKVRMQLSRSGGVKGVRPALFTQMARD